MARLELVLHATWYDWYLHAISQESMENTINLKKNILIKSLNKIFQLYNKLYI